MEWLALKNGFKGGFSAFAAWGTVIFLSTDGIFDPRCMEDTEKSQRMRKLYGFG
jgi:hypothetical protein